MGARGRAHCARTLSCLFMCPPRFALRSGCCRRAAQRGAVGRRHARVGCLRCRVRCAVTPSGGCALRLHHSDSLLSTCRPEAVLRCHRRHCRHSTTTTQSPKRRAAPRARVLPGKAPRKSHVSCRLQVLTGGRLARGTASAADCRSWPGTARTRRHVSCRLQVLARDGSRVAPRQLQTAGLGRGSARARHRVTCRLQLFIALTRAPPDPTGTDAA